MQSSTELYEICCSIDEVKQLLSNLQVNKASAPDNVSSYMLKCVATSIAPSITQLFNQSIKTGKIPTQWKTSMVVPIAKSTKVSDPRNYRQISLTCILCKVLETHIRHLLQEHLQDTSQLSNNQWGFCPKHSTETALATIINVGYIQSLRTLCHVCI